MNTPAAPETCAICGADIPRGAKACPECGADERTGWREQSLYDGLDLPGEESEPKPSRRRSLLLWQFVGLVVLVIMIIAVLRGRW